MIIENIKWAQLNNLYFILPIILVAIALVFKKFIWQNRAIKLLVNNRSFSKFLVNFSKTRQIIKLILIIVSLASISVALLRPQWNSDEQKVKQEGRDLLVAIDISRSMLAQDVNPNRLEFAKNKIKELINKLKASRISLIVFSGDAFVQCPLTNDMSAVITFLNAIDAETISSGTTALQAPIKKAIDMVNSTPTKKSKILAIFTDGEDFSENLKDIKEEAKKADLKIFTFGVGTKEGAPIPISDESGNIKDFLKDDDSKIVITKLNENILKDISNQTGAEYIKDSVNRLVKKVEQFEKEKFDDKVFSVPQEKYYYFALVGFASLLLNWIL